MSFISALEADQGVTSNAIEATYMGSGFLVDLTGLDDLLDENAGFGGGPLIDNPLSGSENR